MRKTLRNLIGAGLIVGSSLVGCAATSQQVRQDEDKKEDVTQGEKLTLLGQMLQLTGKERDSKAGYLLESLGLMQHEREVAREGRNETKQEVNIYNTPKKSEGYMPQQRRFETQGPPILAISHFACSGWEDDGNKLGEKYEFKDRKLIFSRHEPIMVVGCINSSNYSGTGRKLTATINCPNGKRVNYSWEIIKDSFCAKIGGDPGHELEFSDWLFSQGGVGGYQVRWETRGEVVGLTDFEIK
jgi:hypothetical protein